MTADDYNARELAAGRITAEHLTQLTLLAQPQIGLVADGMCGPDTRAHLAAQATIPDLDTAAGLLAAFPQIPEKAARAVEIVLRLRGQGEEGSNNHGPLITQLGGQQGYLWCALTASYGWRQVDAAPWAYRRPGVAEPGARALVEAAAKAGHLFTDPARALPGDLVLWSRDGGHHAGLVWYPDGAATHTVEGNVGHFPAVVHTLVHDVAHEPHFVCFARSWAGPVFHLGDDAGA